ncbi:MAG: TIGR02253 family HAD-type hydrolase [archaeon]
MIKAIIFDLDNTLIDFLTMKKMAVSGAINAMRDAGLDVSHTQADKIMFDLYEKHGMEYQRVFQDFLRLVTGKVDPKILANAIVGYRKVEQGFMKPYPKVKWTLIKLKEKGIKLAILTDAPRMRAWMRLAETELSDFFDVVVTFDDTKVLKPHRKPFLMMLQKLKMKPSEVLMVGDSLDKDVFGGNRLGIKTCHSRYGYLRMDKKKNINPNFTLHRIDELLDIVERS